jgi:hypothetical protein
MAWIPYVEDGSRATCIASQGNSRKKRTNILDLNGNKIDDFRKTQSNVLQASVKCPPGSTRNP